MNVAVILFPGTNCDIDTKYAFEKLGHDVQIIWHKEEKVPSNIDLVVIAGGFSYGDYLRSGAIARFSPIVEGIKAYADKGGKVLGICNGFQILTEAGLLPGALKRNIGLHFISKYHHLKVNNTDNVFLQKLQVGDILNIPIAHADGNYYADETTIKKLHENGQVILQYCDKEGNIDNPNGSLDSIAGISNEAKNVFGLMPHPERAIEAILGSTDGIKMLEGIAS
ncbi:MAG: phosphoribosylformylglycinamidine synthase subunit PurQ [Thiovulaceae bacterium]|nr:phosphoribosylformylglycinamidine synthase subunit PurQ [Sulfurimonadaceae bacterium]